LYICVFFFQAEDGIRDFHVTGVQTCALPIYIGLQSQQPLLRVAQGTTRNPSKCFPGPRAVRYSKCLPILGGVGITIHVGFNLRGTYVANSTKFPAFNASFQGYLCCAVYPAGYRFGLFRWYRVQVIVVKEVSKLAFLYPCAL